MSAGSGAFAESVRRVAVVGDVGGHVDELEAELARLGAVDHRLPADLAVVQVGDLVHRGPSSAAVVELVDHHLRHQPGHWVQLVGNHEAQYLAEPTFAWPERLPPATVATLRRWWADGSVRVAVAVSAGAEDLLVTHAGLTAGYWRERGAPASAQDTADALNGMVGVDEPTLFRAGAMLRRPRRPGRGSRPAPGPLWAEAALELVGSWRGAALPFSQVHGHSSVVDWATGALAPSMEPGDDVRLDPASRHAEVRLDGGRLVGIDPGHGREPHPWRSWELDLH